MLIRMCVRDHACYESWKDLDGSFCYFLLDVVRCSAPRFTKQAASSINVFKFAEYSRYFTNLFLLQSTLAAPCLCVYGKLKKW